MKKLLVNDMPNFHQAKLVHSSLAFLVLLCCGVVFLTAFANQGHAESSKIVKWKDAKGVTHYGDKLPAQEAGSGNSVLNSQGTVIKRNESYSAKTDTSETEKLAAEQLRQDSALLASYSSLEEIDLALNRNIKSDQLTLRTLRQQLSETQLNIKKTNALYAGKKLPADLVITQKNNQAKVTKTQLEIASVEKSIAQTTSRFATYKARYAELRPREHSLTNISAGKKTLVELEAWKTNAVNRLNESLEKSLSYKRAGTAVPTFVEQDIQQANQEIARADEEITAAKSNIKKSQQTFSK